MEQCNVILIKICCVVRTSQNMQTTKKIIPATRNCKLHSTSNLHCCRSWGRGPSKHIYPWLWNLYSCKYNNYFIHWHSLPLKHRSFYNVLERHMIIFKEIWLLIQHAKNTQRVRIFDRDFDLLLNMLQLQQSNFHRNFQKFAFLFFYSHIISLPKNH